MIDLAKVAELRKMETFAICGVMVKEIADTIETLYRENERLLTLNSHVAVRNIELERENAELQQRIKAWEEQDDRHLKYEDALQAVATAARNYWELRTHYGVPQKDWASIGEALDEALKNLKEDSL